MAEYIEREALAGELERIYEWHYEGCNHKAIHDVFRAVMRRVRSAPATDVVPVVRCKDCKHWKKGDFMGGDTPDSMEYGGGCPLVRFARYESDFCSKGERKDGE